MSDILATIDAAIGCQNCGGPLADSVSDDFCGPGCQRLWAAANTLPLDSYSEPYDLFPFNPDQMRWAPLPVFGLPPQTSNLRADQRAAAVALTVAETPAQKAAVRLRMEQLDERGAAMLAEHLRHRAEITIRLVNEAGPQIQAFMEQLSVAFRRIGEALAPAIEGLRQVGLVAQEPKRDDPWQQALAARQTRNTGPAQRQRAPRSLGRAGSIRR